jgi:hypothetical protein
MGDGRIVERDISDTVVGNLQKSGLDALIVIVYISSIADSQIKSVRTIHGTPSGDCDIVSFELAGQRLCAHPQRKTAFDSPRLIFRSSTVDFYGIP